MGISYTNITLKSVDQSALSNYLKALKREAYVSPIKNDCTVIFDKLSDEDVDTLCNLAGELSEKFHCPAFAVLVHDDDLFLYWLYQSGQLIDQYNSMPSYFDADEPPALPAGGDAEKLCEIFQKREALKDVVNIFERAIKTVIADEWSEEHLIGDEIHDVMIQALGLPLFAVDTGYYSIENDELPEDLDKEGLIYCGSE